jgi:oxygen-independent coproporphyrinogen-3 oxidase
MPSTLPEGDPAPPDGALPDAALATLAERPFGIYLHVPFCSVRCGYCDFNTYTLTELGADGASVATFADAAVGELRFAGGVLGHAGPAETVFIGGGTPTMLAPEDLVRMLDGVREVFGLAPEAEVTTEANPDSVTREGLERLAEGGFTRVSVGMQSAVPHVLRVLDRTHEPANVSRAVEAARAAGLHTSVDLIYGTPGESVADWRTSLDAAVALEPDHVSAYALVVEEGTRLAAQVRRGELAAPDDDAMADRYLIADELLGAHGLRWYEISNWAEPGHECRHNLLYWQQGDYVGFGCAAHSHRKGRRWWNVRTPERYIDLVEAGRPAEAGFEELDVDQRAEEGLQLALRMRDGVPAAALPMDEVDGLVSVAGDRAVLTPEGRLLANAVSLKLRPTRG